MSAAAKSCDGMIDQISGQNESRTKFWGVTCETGLRYNQVVKKKYRITQAVLDPSSGSGSDSSDYVLVMFMHVGEEHIMAVLKHGEIHQVNLNMQFDRENVSFYLKGQGTVHLLGYEILHSMSNICDGTNSVSTEVTAFPSNMGHKNSPGDVGVKKSDAGEQKSGKRVKKRKQNDSEEVESPSNALRSKNATDIKVIDFDDDEDDEDDDDFSVEDEEEDDEESDDDDSAEQEIEESEVEKLEEDLEDLEMPLSHRKRKKTAAQQVQKRQKRDSSKNSSPAQKSPIISIDESNSESEDSDSSSDETPIPKKSPVSETKSAEKKKNKKKKKKLSAMANDSPKLNKSQQTVSPLSKSFDNGLEFTDIKVGYGPAVAKGKMLHVYYIGRLPDKTVFDSKLSGNKPFSFVYGAGKVIKGWELGLEGMRAGGKRKIKIPPSLGYGKAEIEGVPANSTLFFVVEVVAVS